MKKKAGSVTLALGALGVVYGDLGTSPLYTMNETFFGHQGLSRGPADVLGAASLCFWSLTLVVSIKYVILIMRADNDGEGGLFALYGLLGKASKRNSAPDTSSGRLRKLLLFGLVLMGAALLYGDGIITPAMTVLSAMEGLAVLNPRFADYQVIVAVAILAVLLIIQRKGTHRIGFLFGPVMVLWFIAIGACGIARIIEQPTVLKALLPNYAVSMLIHHGWKSVIILGSIVLCITGVEAMYADVGHFGRKAITRAWFFLAFPCLVANYFGQAACLLGHGKISNNNVFYAIAPEWAMVPYLILATAATVIASQALISGAFSLTQQAIALGLLPRLKIVHTNPDMRGQIYIPFINNLLFAGCVGLVVGFKTSSSLAAAYGLAVTGTMLVTTTAFYVVARRLWGWRRRWLIPLMVLVIAVDLAFFGSNLLKFTNGGYIPFVIAVALFIVMDTWRWGRTWLAYVYRERPPGQRITLRQLVENKPRYLDKSPSVSLVVMASRPVLTLDDDVPPVMAIHYHNWRMLPNHIIFFSVVHDNSPYVDKDNRLEMTMFSHDQHGTVVSARAHYGYMEQPKVRKALIDLKQRFHVKIPSEPRRWLILVGAERFATPGRTWLERLRIRLFARINRSAKPVTDYFGLAEDAGVSTETINI